MMNPQANGCSEKTQNGSGEMLGNASSSNSNQTSSKRKFSKREAETVRLIGQHLRYLGLNQTVEQLIAESGCPLESGVAAKFRKFVMDGKWEDAHKTLEELAPLTSGSKKQLELLLLEQKYLELLDDGAVLEAVQCLRNELAALSFCTDRVHKLTTLVMCNGQAELRAKAKWEGKGPASRQLLVDKIQEFLPATVMLPPRRLERLMQQAQDWQADKCLYHNDKLRSPLPSLLTDHSCSSDNFPCHTSQTLTHHDDEVWICRFSPDGLKLATGSKDCTVCVYDVDPERNTVGNHRELPDHSYGVAYLAWSPDSKYLAVCGPEDSTDLWVWSISQSSCVLKTKVSQSGDDSLTCVAWQSDSQHFYCGGGKGQFYLCDLSGAVLQTWEGVRVQCLQCSVHSQIVYCADTHFRIRAYNFDEVKDFTVIQEEHPIMCFSLDLTGRYALMNIASLGVHIWDLQDQCLIRRYQGVQQGLFAIYSCFGGSEQQFVASGSEDGKVYVWHRRREEPLMMLDGHASTVNCVHWNPVYSHMLASASDDATVRIWTPKPTDTNDVRTEERDVSENTSTSV